VAVKEPCPSRRSGRRLASNGSGLIVVLPEAARDSHTHYAHYARLVEEIAALVRVAVVVEKGDPVAIPGVSVLAQRETRPIPRAIELARILTRLRLKGFRVAYGSYSPYFGVVGGIVGRFLGLRTAYWHCRSDFFDRAIGAKPDVRRLIFGFGPLFASVHLCRYVVTGTENLAELYARTFRLRRQKVLVVPNDVDLSAFNSDPAPTDSTPTVLFVHRLTRHQGSHLLPHIYRKVAFEVPFLRLLVVGGGPGEARLRADFREEIAEGRVRLTGYRPNTEVRKLMCEAHVLLMPSMSEGFPRVLLEAMAAGLPFVASETGGVPEIVGPQARRRLVTPGDVDGFARETLALLTDGDVRAALREEGRRHVERYDVRRVARVFVDQLCRR
jgi:glycosyltransferase involved in cell wall biosynthesis